MDPKKGDRSDFELSDGCLIYTILVELRLDAADLFNSIVAQTVDTKEVDKKREVIS